MREGLGRLWNSRYSFISCTLKGAAIFCLGTLRHIAAIAEYGRILQAW